MKLNERYSHDLSPWQKKLGIWRINTDSIDFKWGYFCPKAGFELIFNHGFYFSETSSITICLGWGKVNIKLPWFKNAKTANDCEWPKYGVYLFCNTLYFCRGTKSNKHWDLPFVSLIHEKHEVQQEDGTWVDYVGIWEKGKEPDNRYTEDLIYMYTLKSGEIQWRVATVHVERRTWRRKWLPWVKHVRKSIDVEFSDEVGERTGSWKGGTIGCGYDMLPGETLRDTLYRMQDERTFN